MNKNKNVRIESNQLPPTEKKRENIQMFPGIWKGIRKRVIPKLIPGIAIPELENEGIAFLPFHDMAVTFWMQTLLSGEYALLPVTLKLLEIASISVEELYSDMEKKLEESYTIREMSDIIGPINPGLSVENPIHMLVISNKQGVYGAAVILNKNVLLDVQKRLGERFAILPSSVHECIAVPYTEETELQVFLETVRAVNATELKPEELLADNVYIWNGEGLRPLV